MKKRWEQKHLDFLKETQDMLMTKAYNRFCEAFPDFSLSYGNFAQKRSKCGFCNAKIKRLKWTEEMLDAVKQTKGQDRYTAYKFFCEKFPNVTETAFHNQRSILGVVKSKPHGSNRRAKLYEERIKGGYILIKVAEPAAWISKARWVWEETHPGEQTAKTDNFVFLNGNNRDFRPANIERIESKYRTLFLKFGGVDENPEVTKIRILQAKMRAAQLDLGEKIGTVKLCGKHGRYEIKRG